MDKAILTISEVSEYTGFSVSYLYKCTCKGKIPFYKPLGKRVFFKREEIEGWLCSNRHATTDEVEANAIKYCLTNRR